MEGAAFKMKLFPGKEAEYKQRHDEIWPGLQSLLKETWQRNIQKITAHGI